MGNSKRENGKSIEKIKIGEITRAVKDSSYNGLKIEEGDIIGLTNDEVKVAGKNIETVCLDLLSLLVDGDSEVISVFMEKMYLRKKQRN